MKNKKGDQSMIPTVIAIALGIALFVFLIFGFSTEWSNLWDRVVNIGGGSANIGTIKQSCEIACTAQNKDGYCNMKRTVKFGESKPVLAEGDATETCSDSGVKLSKSCVATCSQLSVSKNTAINSINFPTCSQINCAP